MRIGLLIDSFRVGGAEMLCLNICRGFITLGHTVSVIALGVTGPMESRFTSCGATCYALKCSQGIHLRSMVHLYHIFKKHHLDLVVSNHFRQLLYCWLPAWAGGIHHFHVEHDNLIYRNSSKYLWLLKFMQFRLQSLVTISPTLQQWFSKNLSASKGRIHLISNGVDPSIFHEDIIIRKALRKDLGLDETYVIVGTCARLEPIKNISLMLKIFKKFHDHLNKSKLIIIGDGSCRNQLENEAIELHLEKEVIFTGMRTLPVSYLQAMDLYLVTSDDEGLPLSVLEAMSCGVPIVSRDVGDLTRIITLEFGAVVKSTDPECWTIAMLQVLNKSELRHNCQRLVTEQYSIQKCIDSYLSLFMSTLRGKSRKVTT